MSGNWDKRKTIPRKRPERKPVVREISNGDDDVIITRLGDDSVRWIKTRRPRNSDLKVALSIYEEKQVIYNLPSLERFEALSQHIFFFCSNHFFFSVCLLNTAPVPRDLRWFRF
jgi:hypothetical protein